MNEIISTISLSNTLNSIKAVYLYGNWRNDKVAADNLRSVIYKFSNVHPNDWYFTDEEDELIREIDKELSNLAKAS